MPCKKKRKYSFKIFVVTPGDVHVPAAMPGLSIRGHGPKRKKKKDTIR